jgi:hypothetical protein
MPWVSKRVLIDFIYSKRSNLEKPMTFQDIDEKKIYIKRVERLCDCDGDCEIFGCADFYDQNITYQYFIPTQFTRLATRSSCYLQNLLF